MPPKKPKKDGNVNWLWIEEVQELNQISDKNVETAYGFVKHYDPTPTNSITTSTTDDNNTTVVNDNSHAASITANGNSSSMFSIEQKLFQPWVDGQMDWSSDDEDESPDVRGEGEFVGLTNLGATCYVNTFLQLSYHNLAFRNAVFDWSSESENKSSVCSTLQYIFGLLELTERSSIDPSPLIETLGLNAHMQQDAQEFSKLFIELLESQAIKNLFRGSYDYVTRCNHCKTESRHSSTFYELDLSIEGTNQLQKSLTEFLKVENLDGDNQYFCSPCQVKQDATRRIHLQTLPPVLNIQLLRFVFDRKTGQKKKLSTNIQFPDKLDLTLVVGDGKEEFKYALVAVLLHNGMTASSGHYTAHIQKSDAWYKFNDERVIKLKGGKKLNLANEETDDYSTEKSKLLKPRKGYHSSKSAYMLVYHRKSFTESLAEIQPSPVPEDIVESVEMDNIVFRELNETADMKRTEEIMTIDLKKEFILDICNNLEVKDGENFYIIPTAWLEKMLADQCDIPSIDSRPILCRHHKLSLAALNKCKAIPEKLGQRLCKYQSGEFTAPLTRKDSLCIDCVRNQFALRKKKFEVETDVQAINTYMAYSGNDESTRFWVNKTDLRRWKGMILKPLEAEAAITIKKKGDGFAEPVQNGVESQKAVTFNDIQCEHGNLCIEEKQRQLVPSLVWEILLKHFPTAPQFTADSEPCHQCRVDEQQGNAFEKQRLTIIKEEKKILQSLASLSNRPDLLNLKVEKVYCMAESSYRAWKTFLRSPASENALHTIDNSSLLCPHGGLMFKPDDSTSIVLLWPYEWDVLTSHFPWNHIVTVTPTPERVKKELRLSLTDIKATHPHLNGCSSLDTSVSESTMTTVLPLQPVTSSFKQHNGSISSNNIELAYRVSPEFCQNCYSQYQLAKEVESHYFDMASIYVRLLDNNRNEESTSESMDAKPKLKADDSRRRSGRKRKSRDEKCVRMSSKATLKELKIELVKLFAIAPFDQRLSVDGKVLEGDNHTLASHGLYPDCIVCVQNEANDEYSLEQFQLDYGVAEEGFRGTNLLATKS